MVDDTREYGVTIDPSSGELPIRPRRVLAAVSTLPTTDDTEVNALVAQVTQVPQVPAAEQVQLLEAVHRGLQNRLSDVES